MTTPLPADQTDPAGLLLLMQWLSPAFPVGGFSYSHGLEYAVDAGLLTGRESITNWIGFILSDGAGRTDAALFLAAHRAVCANDPAALQDTAELGEALRGSREMALESRAQGQAFRAALLAGWGDSALAGWQAALGPAPPYCVMLGVATACAGLGEAIALTAVLQSFAAALVSAAVRLVPLGQTDGVRVLAQLAEQCPALVQAARARPPEDFGSCALMVDWTSLSHETQYTRLFRS